MNQLSEQREEIIAILQREGPLKMADIMERSELTETEKQMSNFLYNMRKGGLITRTDDNVYSALQPAVPANQAAEPLQARKSAPQKTGEKKVQKKVQKTRLPATGTRRVTEMLQSSLDAAQAALDEYVFEVGDPSILTPLMESRDKAREAMEAYQRS